MNKLLRVSSSLVTLFMMRKATPKDLLLTMVCAYANWTMD